MVHQSGIAQLGWWIQKCRGGRWATDLPYFKLDIANLQYFIVFPLWEDVFSQITMIYNYFWKCILYQGKYYTVYIFAFEQLNRNWDWWWWSSKHHFHTWLWLRSSHKSTPQQNRTALPWTIVLLLHLLKFCMHNKCCKWKKSVHWN